MQPMTMAMNRGHIDDDKENGNHHHHLAQLSIPPGRHDSTRSDSPSTHQNLHPHLVSPDIKPDTHGSSLQHLHTEVAAGGYLADTMSLAREQEQQVTVSRPEQLFRSASSPAEECSDSFCNLASSTVDSDSSSSPDINSNTLLVGFGQTDISRDESDIGTPPCVSQAHLDDQKMVRSMAVSSSDRGEEPGGGEAHAQSEQMMTARGDQTQQKDKSANNLPAVLVDSGTSTGNGHSTEKEDLNWNLARQQGGVLQSEERRKYGLASQQSSVLMVRSLSGLHSRGAHSSGDSTQLVDVGLPHRIFSQRDFPGDVPSRQSVDMDVECDDIDEMILLSEGSPSLPEILSQAGAIGNNPSTSIQSSDASFSPDQFWGIHSPNHQMPASVPVPMEPSPSGGALHSVGPGDSSIQGSSLQVSTVSMFIMVHLDNLSSTTSTRNENRQESSSMHFAETETMQSFSADVEDKNIKFSAADVETETPFPAAYIETETMRSSSANTETERLSSLESSRWTSPSSSHSPNSPANCVSPAAAHNTATEQLLWKTNDSHIDTNSLSSCGDDLQEEDVEEELFGLTSYGAWSWNGETSPTSADRVDLSDPVARLLSEGDHTHFVPIDEEDITPIHPPGSTTTADTASNTPG